MIEKRFKRLVMFLFFLAWQTTPFISAENGPLLGNGGNQEASPVVPVEKPEKSPTEFPGQGKGLGRVNFPHESGGPLSPPTEDNPSGGNSGSSGESSESSSGASGSRTAEGSSQPAEDAAGQATSARTPEVNGNGSERDTFLGFGGAREFDRKSQRELEEQRGVEKDILSGNEEENQWLEESENLTGPSKPSALEKEALEEFDTDGDGIENSLDTDIDGDGLMNWVDSDMDGDGIANDRDLDTDGDGLPNDQDPDIDADGIPNGKDSDIDGDGIPNNEDPDIDGDGIPNERDLDMDGDGIPNSEDPDIDGDSIPNEVDNDMDGDSFMNVEDSDIDGDGIPNESDPSPNGYIESVKPL